ncbi:putative tetratricopeptide-like helical domain superfamily [Helianthus anomalus]
MWESTMVNLAHALRKLKGYDEAITYYEKALELSTRNLSTHVGFTRITCRIIIQMQLHTITSMHYGIIQMTSSAQKC